MIVTKSLYVETMTPGQEMVNEPFLLQEANRRQTKDGRPFLILVLRDRSGQVNGIFWDVPPYIEEWVRPGLAVLVTGRVGFYKDSLQVTITDLNRASDVELGDLLPSSKRDRVEMLVELRAYVDSLAEPYRALATDLLLNGPYAERFAEAPAARLMHHAYVSGLLEHVLSMAALAEVLAAHYGRVDRDLLLTGTLLHDVGKTVEYSLEDGITTTEDGRLVGHIVRAVVMVEQAAAKLGFPEDKLRELVHLIVSHHGTQEWGSPIVPKTLEAVLLHQLDLLDSRVQGFLDHVESDGSDGDWTTRPSKMFGTQLRRPYSYDAYDESDSVG